MPGARTAQRVELCAVVQAARRRRGPLLLVTESQYAADGVGRLAARRGGADGLHGDLWAALWAARGGCEGAAGPFPPSRARAPGSSPPTWSGFEDDGKGLECPLVTAGTPVLGIPEIDGTALK